MTNTNYQELAKDFIERNINLIDENRFLDLFYRAEKDCNIGTIKEIKNILNISNIDYISELEEMILLMIEHGLGRVFLRDERKVISAVDFCEFYLSHSLGYELDDILQFIPKIKFPVPLEIRIQDIDGYSTTVIACSE